MSKDDIRELDSNCAVESCPGCGHPAPGHLPTCGAYRKPTKADDKLYCTCKPVTKPGDVRMYDSQCPGCVTRYGVAPKPDQVEVALAPDGTVVIADIPLFLKWFDEARPDRTIEHQFRWDDYWGTYNPKTNEITWEVYIPDKPAAESQEFKAGAGVMDAMKLRWDQEFLYGTPSKPDRIAELSEIIGLDLVKMKEKYSPSGVDGILSDGAIDADEKAMDTAAYVIRTLIEWIESCREVRDLDPRIAELREWFNRDRSDMTTMDLMRVWMSGKSLANELLDMLEEDPHEKERMRLSGVVLQQCYDIGNLKTELEATRAARKREEKDANKWYVKCKELQAKLEIPESCITNEQSPRIVETLGGEIKHLKAELEAKKATIYEERGEAHTLINEQKTLRHEIEQLKAKLEKATRLNEHNVLSDKVWLATVNKLKAESAAHAKMLDDCAEGVVAAKDNTHQAHIDAHLKAEKKLSEETSDMVIRRLLLYIDDLRTAVDELLPTPTEDK